MKCSGDFGSVSRGRIERRHTGPGSFLPRPIVRPLPVKPVPPKRSSPGYQTLPYRVPARGMQGVSYTRGDFVTPGTSGMGFSLNDVFTTVFGDGAEAVKQTLQSGATNVATNVVGTKLGQDPNAQAAVTKTGIEAAKAIFNEYWYVTYPLTAAAFAVVGMGLFGLVKNMKKA